MVDALILETTFLVDLERELASGREGRAQRFLQANEYRAMHVTFTIAGELAAGPRLSDRANWDRMVEPFVVLGCTPEVSWRYGRLYRYLKDNGLAIGANDLWIAATALVFGMPLVTRNERHFARVPDLDVIGYA